MSVGERPGSRAGETADPRLGLAAALGQTQVEVDATRPGDLGRSTPCADYDVRTLLAHLVAVLRKLATVGCGGDMTGIADPALAEAAIHWYSRNVPAESRTEGGPFGPVVEVPADADVYTRLAGLVRPGGEISGVRRAGSLLSAPSDHFSCGEVVARG